MARQAGGAFVLRIEDTDRERSTPQAKATILEGLRWLELDWDEGPFSQADRIEGHREAVRLLLEGGKAYRSTATAEDVKRAREISGGDGYRGAEAPAGMEAAVRLRVPDGETVVEDLIRGTTRFENRLLDDFVIARADGTPLYNLAVAVDDLEMGITHVVRGEDHLSNTPRQLIVLKALGQAAPIYAHLPLLHGKDGKKLSKRHGATTVEELRRTGFLPQAVRNCLALLGWSYDDKTTIFSTEELVERFSVERVSKAPAVFDEDKLRWMNGHYIRELGSGELATAVGKFLAAADDGARLSGAPPKKLVGAAALAQEKISTLSEFWELAGLFFERPAYDPQAWDKVFGDGAAFEMLRRAREALARSEDFSEGAIEAALRRLVEELGCKPRDLFQPIRVAISGKTVSPGIFESLALLERDEALARIDSALARKQNSN